jgi:formiminoglutamase
MLTPTDPNLLFSKNDSADPRLGELSKPLPVQDFLKSAITWGLVGYPDDEGIVTGGGRPGAALGPDQIRNFFYKMTPSIFSQHMEGVADLGNVKGSTLATRHDFARSLSKQCYKSDKKLASLGGGHDYGYADVAGFLDIYKNEHPLIINFDAHLDVRPLDRGLTSGTPFHRVLSEFEGGYDFVELGIQSQCNSQNHLRWAQNHGAHIIFLEEIWQKGMLESLKPFLKARRPLFLSVDIDAFTSSEAPGCSQSWTTGIKAQELLELLGTLHSKMDIRGVGIYEVSPPLDQDHRTSKLAALILHHLIYL